MSRKVKICTISMDSRIAGMRSMDAAWQEIEEKIKQGAVDAPDLFLLPEACLSGLADERLSDNHWYVKPGDQYCRRFSEMAKTYNSYIAASVLTLHDGKRYNSVLVFDRNGKLTFTYDKVCLTQPELAAGMAPGNNTPDCFHADFGKVGFAVCFDLNYRELFENYHRKGMELLLFPSYFPGGRILSNIAFDFSCFAVSSHAQGDESVFIDNFGRETARANMFTPALTQLLELDAAVLHLSGNLSKVSMIKAKYGDKVEIEIHRPEALMIIRAVSAGITVDDIILEFQLQSLKDFFGATRME